MDELLKHFWKQSTVLVCGIWSAQNLGSTWACHVWWALDWVWIDTCEYNRKWFYHRGGTAASVIWTFRYFLDGKQLPKPLSQVVLSDAGLLSVLQSLRKFILSSLTCKFTHSKARCIYMVTKVSIPARPPVHRSSLWHLSTKNYTHHPAFNSQV